MVQEARKSGEWDITQVVSRGKCDFETESSGLDNLKRGNCRHDSDFNDISKQKLHVEEQQASHLSICIYWLPSLNGLRSFMDTKTTSMPEQKPFLQEKSF